MSFILRRLAFYAVAAWVALTANFFLPRAMPGNAVQAIMSKFPSLQPSAYKALEAMLGVGHPGSLWHQYVEYLRDVFTLNFGIDLSQYPAKVSTLLGETIPWTLTLVGSATVIAFVVGTGLGIIAGWRHGGWFDRALPGLMFFQAIPYFFLALILIELLAARANIFPIGQGYDGGLIPGWNSAFIGSAIYHSILPQLQGFGLALGFVVSGAIVMEIVFSYPGIGLLLLSAVTSNDYPLMQAIFLVITFAVLLANLILDFIIVAVDPRARTKEAAR